MRSSASTVVLLYHRVAALTRDPQQLAVSPENFADHLDVINELASAAPLWDVKHRSAQRRVSVTFDDGYADNDVMARPLLEAASVPATVFVTTSFTDEQCLPWWDELEVLLLDSPADASHLDLRLGGQRLRADIRSPSAKQRAYDALHPRLRELYPAQIQETLLGLAAQLRVDRPRPTSMLSTDQLRSLAASPLIDIGSHAVSHGLLAHMSATEQRAELTSSRSQLEALLERPVRSFSYPFGGFDSFSLETVRSVEYAGYSLACANVPGAVSSAFGRWRIPRRLVRDWPKDEFRRRLVSWLAG